MQNKSHELQADDDYTFADNAKIFAGGFCTLLFAIGYGLNQWGII